MSEGPFSFVFLLIAGGMFLGGIAMVGGFLHYRRDRLLTHTERMRAIEMGRDFPDDPAVAQMRVLMGIDGKGKAEGESASGRCYSTAFWVAFWGFVTTGGVIRADVPVVVPVLMALSIGAIGVVSVICGTILAKKEMDARALAATGYRKPHYEPDAFDVVGSRG